MAKNIKESIKSKAYNIGFDAIGFTPAALDTKIGTGLFNFIAAGHHGDMAWMEDRAAMRAQPQALWPQAKSVIMLGHNYGPDYNPLDHLAHKSRGLISSYALGKDYHDVIKKKLKQLGRWLCREYDCDIKVFVDTAPVMEKPLAMQAGIGWQGKHTCVVSREFGSWLFLGCIYTTLELEADAPEIDHCGSCQQCLDICPTDAFIGAGKIDARRCISYLTIEHKEQIPEEFRKAIGNRIYGCDDCLAVCPWNKFAQVSSEAKYHARESTNMPTLAELAVLDDAAFRSVFSGSPIKRIGRNRFIRNVLIAIGNSEDIALLPAAQRLKADSSPLVQEMAVWAEKELAASRT